MFNLPSKNPDFKPLEAWQLKQLALVDGALGLFQRDNIAEQIEKDIDKYSLEMYWEDKPRHHLGASVIGHYCNRYIWMNFRWLSHKVPEPRMPRLWYRGHREEPVIIEQLRGIGCKVIEITDQEDQIGIKKDSADGHFGGSLDALIQLPVRYGLPPFWILLEMKTVGSKYFKDMKNLGVLKAREMYAAQMCVYGLKITELGTYGSIDYALFYGVNKDTDENDIEFLSLDHNIGREQILKAEYITKQYYPPARLSEDGSFFQCKMCTQMHGICHGKQQVQRNCRSCKFAEPVANGQWHCHSHGQIIPKDFLIKGCSQWQSLPL